MKKLTAMATLRSYACYYWRSMVSVLKISYELFITS